MGRGGCGHSKMRGFLYELGLYLFLALKHGRIFTRVWPSVFTGLGYTRQELYAARYININDDMMMPLNRGGAMSDWLRLDPQRPRRTISMRLTAISVATCALALGTACADDSSGVAIALMLASL